GELADHETLLVDRDVADVDTHAQDRTDRLVGLRAAVAGVLEGHAGHAALAGQGAQHQVDSLRETGADDHLRRAGGGGSYPPQVPGEDVAQHLAAARVTVPQVRGGRLGARLLDGPGPVRPREAGQVRHAGLEIRDQRRPRGQPDRLRQCDDGWSRCELAAGVLVAEVLVVGWMAGGLPADGLPADGLPADGLLA